jgi:PadR family transcriptional regulator PadR
MDNLNPDGIQKTLDFLILNTPVHEPMCASDIEQRIGQGIRRFFEANRVSFSNALQRLESAGWLDSEWRQTEGSSLEKVYSVTRAGNEQLEAEWKGRKSLLAEFVEEGKWPVFRFQKAQADSWN